MNPAVHESVSYGEPPSESCRDLPETAQSGQNGVAPEGAGTASVHLPVPGSDDPKAEDEQGVEVTAVERIYVETDKIETFKKECGEYIVLDCGATSNLNGALTSDRAQHHMMASGKDLAESIEFDTGTVKEFRFGDNQTGYSSGLLSLHTSLFGRKILYQSHTVNGAATFLGSVHFLSKLDAIIMFKRGVGYFPALDPDHIYELKRMASGHLGLALEDDGTRHRKYSIKDDKVIPLLEKAAAAFDATPP